MSEYISPPEAASRPKNEIELKGFKQYEILEIKAENLISAYEQIGKETARYAKQALEGYKNKDKYPETHARATKSLDLLKELAQTDIFTTSDGLNHLERYLQTLAGFATGTGLTPQEVALLQIEDTAGCQTLSVSNTISGEIVAIHTEEDSDQYAVSENAANAKRWVKLILPDQQVEYCAYGSLCGYGFASGIIDRQRQTMFQCADIIGPTELGPIWANAMAFMMMDAGSLNYSNELNAKVSTAFPNHPLFNGGYVIHQIESGRPPKMQSLEFGGDRIVLLEPKESAGRQFQFGVNYPQDSRLLAIDGYTLSADDGDREVKRMMQRRQRRLELIACLAGRTPDTFSHWGEHPALEFLHKILQKGRGDVLDGWFTGLSNDLVAQSISVYASPEGKLHLIVRSGYSKAQRKMRHT
jgi:hypothetical protein